MIIEGKFRTMRKAKKHLENQGFVHTPTSLGSRMWWRHRNGWVAAISHYRADDGFYILEQWDCTIPEQRDDLLALVFGTVLG